MPADQSTESSVMVAFEYDEFIPEATYAQFEAEPRTMHKVPI